MRLRLTEILDFYDVPQLFVAMDAVGTSYLCLVHDYDADGRSLCIAVNISQERLNDLVTGHLDLRQIYLAPEQAWFDVIDDGKTIVARLRTAAPTEDMLPEEGYFLDFAKRENRDMLMAAQEERKTVIRIAFNYETNNHTVPTDVLTNTVHNFQGILMRAFKKVTKEKTAEKARLLVRAPIAASFDLELVANEETDLFGGSKVADTLNRLSPLFSNEDEAVANCLASFKTAQTNYRNLMRVLSEKNISFKCKWVQGIVDGEVGECPVTKERVQSLYNLASSLQLVDEIDVVLEGSFFMANVRNGRWGLSQVGQKKPKYGMCPEIDKLDGITMKSQRYRVFCTEKHSLNPNTNKEYKTYIINEIQKIHEEG